MAVGVERQRQTRSADRLGEHLEVARRVLLFPEDRPAEPPDGIVDAADEREPGSPSLEPVVPRAVGLEEHAGPGHPFAAAAVTGRPAGPRRRPSGFAQEP